MASLRRRSNYSANIWPGFVDALATLLMVTMFLLVVFVLAQFFLGEAISGRDSALRRLESEVTQLGNLLALERLANDELSLNVVQLSTELQASVRKKDDLNDLIDKMSRLAETAASDKADLSRQLAAVAMTVKADKETIEIQVAKLAKLANAIAALEALKEELESRLIKSAKDSEIKNAALIEAKNLSDSAQAQIALLNKQMAAVREQLKQLSLALDISERLTEEQNVKIVNLGTRLNAALASKVQELSRYRSEFFGRLRKVLGSQAGIRIIGDRFVFQSEVLFSSGSAILETPGRQQLDQLAKTLLEVAAKIPSDIDWVLRVDGHTDKIPIATARFPSNWELSSARAISVVKSLMSHGIPANQLVAAGFGQYQPLDSRDDEIAYRRNRRIEFKLTQR